MERELSVVTDIGLISPKRDIRDDLSLNFSANVFDFIFIYMDSDDDLDGVILKWNSMAMDHLKNGAFDKAH